MKSMQTKNWDRDKVWSNIEKELRKKKKRRGMIWFWIGASSLLTTILLFLWLGRYHPTNSKNSFEELSSSTEKANLRQLPQANIYSNSSQSEVNTISSELSSSNFEEKKPGEGFNRTTSLNPLLTKSKGSPQISPSSQKTIQSDSLFNHRNLFPDQNSFIDVLPGEVLNTPNELPKKRIAILLPIDQSTLSPLTWSRDLDVFPTMKTKSMTKGFTRTFRIASTLGTGSVQHVGSSIWTQAKESSESLEYVSTNTVGMDWYFSKKGYFFTGLSYQLIRSRYEYTTTQTRVAQSIESDSAIIYPLPGQNIYEPGVLQETQITRRSIIHNNALHRFSVPAGVGFIQDIGRFQLETRIGIRLQFAQQFDGVSLNEISLNHVLDNKQSNERYYPDYLSLGLTGSFLLNYPIKKNHFLFLGLQYDQDGLLYFPNPTYQNAYKIWGMQLGWKKEF